jgi:hypothetical protein
MFMARLVRNPEVRERVYSMPPMPQLQDFALERYSACVGNRIGEFPENGEVDFKIKKDTEIEYSHRLPYDAESILWLLLWWAIQAKPLKGGDRSLIHEHLWVTLTGGDGAEDPRKFFIESLGPRDTICHPLYRDLDELLRSLFKQLSGYQEQVARPDKDQDSSRMKDEYLHEAFQRTILDFIVKNIEATFMQAQINPIRRRKEGGGGMPQSTKTAASLGMKRCRAEMTGGETDDCQPRYVCPHVFPSRWC